MTRLSGAISGGVRHRLAQPSGSTDNPGFQQINLDTFGRAQTIFAFTALKTSRRLLFALLVLAAGCVAFVTMASVLANFTINDASVTGTQVTSASARFEIHGTVGMAVSGAGIADGTYVTAVVNDTTVTLSAPTSFSGNNRTLTFGKALTDGNRSGNAGTKGALAPALIAMKDPPKGMYIFPSGFISATNQAVASAGPAISNANCDGVRWLLKWKDVEATPNTYTWQYLDDAVALAAANGKKCGISIDAGLWCPAWLFAAPYNAQSYTLTDTPDFTGPIPVPGDSVFMTRWQKFVTDFGARYNNNATVSFILVTGIGNHDEWNVADGFNDTAALGDTVAKVNAWKSSSKQIIDFHMNAFPSTTVMGYPRPPFNPANAAENPLTSMKEVSDYAANTYACHFGYGVAPLQSSTDYVELSSRQRTLAALDDQPDAWRNLEPRNPTHSGGWC